MTINTEDLINSILESMDRIEHIKVSDLPDIDLYVDQVTTFMQSKLQHSTRNPEDKIMTKTMINNYAKNNLLPPPVKKKYSRMHMLLLIFIYYYKGVMSIGDIQSLLGPLTEQYFDVEDGLNLESIYEEVFSLEKEHVNQIKEQLLEEYSRAMQTFSDVSEEEAEHLKLFAFICMLSFDVYVKKLLIEKLIDGFTKNTD